MCVFIFYTLFFIVMSHVFETKYESENHTPYVCSVVYLVRTKACSNKDTPRATVFACDEISSYTFFCLEHSHSVMDFKLKSERAREKD